MSNIEHLLENALIYMERGKDFDEWVSEEETRRNMPESGVMPMSYASFWALANYVRYSYMECYVEKVIEQLEKMLDYSDSGDSDYIETCNACISQAIEVVKGIKKMSTGVTIYINGIGYWFEECEELVQLLDMNCNDAEQSDRIQDSIIYDDEYK